MVKEIPKNKNISTYKLIEVSDKMKDCHVYFKTICTCDKQGYCFDKEGGCEYATPNKICLNCDNYNGDILKCYNCEKCKQINLKEVIN